MKRHFSIRIFLLFVSLTAVGCAVSSPGKMSKSAEDVTLAASRVSVHGITSYSGSLDDNPLFQAEQANDVHEMQNLLKQGADPNQHLVDSEPVIDFAASDGHLALVRLLLRYKPKLSQSEVHAHLQKAKDVALDTAVTEGRLKDVDSLLTEGANVNNEVDDGSNGVGSPLMRATALGSLKLMDHLMARGANVNQQDSYGRTALMFVGAVNMYYSPYNESADYDVPVERLKAWPARLLIRHGARINVCDHSGKTPLMWAAQDNPQVVSLLLTHGARVDVRDKTGRTALLCAASVRDPASMTCILAAGANINAQDKDGETPLMRASVQPDPPADAEDRTNRREAIALLVKHNANSHLRDKQRRTVADYAKMTDGNFINAS